MSITRPTGKNGLGNVKISDVHVNVDQEIIHITEDKIRLILQEHIHCIAKSRDWIAALGLVLSITMTLCTATFDKFLGLSGEFWRAIFSISLIISIAWLVSTIAGRQQILTIDSLIDKMKNKS